MMFPLPDRQQIDSTNTSNSFYFAHPVSTTAVAGGKWISIQPRVFLQRKKQIIRAQQGRLGDLLAVQGDFFDGA